MPAPCTAELGGGCGRSERRSWPSVPQSGAEPESASSGPRPVTAPRRARVPGGGVPRGGRHGPAALKLRLGSVPFPGHVSPEVAYLSSWQSFLPLVLRPVPGWCPAAPLQGAGDRASPDRGLGTRAERGPPAWAGGTPVGGSHSPPRPPAGPDGGPRGSIARWPAPHLSPILPGRAWRCSPVAGQVAPGDLSGSVWSAEDESQHRQPRAWRMWLLPRGQADLS